MNVRFSNTINYSSRQAQLYLNDEETVKNDRYATDNKSAREALLDFERRLIEKFVVVKKVITTSVDNGEMKVEVTREEKEIREKLLFSYLNHCDLCNETYRKIHCSGRSIYIIWCELCGDFHSVCIGRGYNLNKHLFELGHDITENAVKLDELMQQHYRVCSPIASEIASKLERISKGIHLTTTSCPIQYTKKESTNSIIHRMEGGITMEDWDSDSYMEDLPEQLNYRVVLDLDIHVVHFLARHVSESKDGNIILGEVQRITRELWKHSEAWDMIPYIDQCNCEITLEKGDPVATATAKLFNASWIARKTSGCCPERFYVPQFMAMRKTMQAHRSSPTTSKRRVKEVYNMVDRAVNKRRGVEGIIPMHQLRDISEDEDEEMKEKDEQ